jgi:hypothetical protein
MNIHLSYRSTTLYYSNARGTHHPRKKRPWPAAGRQPFCAAALATVLEDPHKLRAALRSIALLTALGLHLVAKYQRP